MKKLFTVLMLAGMLAGTRVYAGGFQINEHGARAMGMGGAFTALALDPSSLYFNNAAIAKLSGFQLMLGTTLIMPKASFRGPSPSVKETKMEDQTFTPSHLYATYRLNNKLVVGLGFNNPFGLGTKWPANWDGRFVSIEADLKTFSLNPVVAYSLTDNLSVGVGLQYNFAQVTLVRQAAFAPFAGEGQVNLEGDEMAAFGFTAGVLYQPMAALSLGLSYRSQVGYNFEGTAETKGAPAQLAANVPSGDIAATFNSPAQLVAGAAYQLMPKLLLSADFQYVFWSSYDYLRVDFDKANLADLASPRLYEDTYIVRVGAQYSVNDALHVQGGFIYDKNPVKDEYVDASLPDSDRLGFSGGVGYKVTNKLSLDLSYLFLRFAERTVTTSTVVNRTGADLFNGTYNSTASLASVSLSYNF